MERSRRVSLATLTQYTVLCVLVFLSFSLILLMVSLSLRPTLLITVDFWRLLPWPPYFGNYQRALASLIVPTLRSLIVSAASILGILALSAMASYAFARLRFAGQQAMFYLVIAVMTIPGIIVLTPDFILANQLRLRGTLFGLVVFYVAGGLPFAIFLIASFFKSQPAEIFEAARVDGASDLGCLLRIAVPLSLPILVTVGIVNFLGIYGDFIWPSLMLNSENQTLMLALQQFNPPPVNQFLSVPDIGAQTAGYTFATVPQLIVFAFGMKYYIQGVTSGAVKA